jgi:uncharacterized lipoprotein YddW (UPF0748 family)
MSGLRNSPVAISQIQYQVRAAQQRKLGIVFFYYESLWNSAPEPASERIAEFKNFFPYPVSRFNAYAQTPYPRSFSPWDKSFNGEKALLSPKGSVEPDLEFFPLAFP